MAIRKLKQACLSCKHYRPADESQGKCRVDKGNIDSSVYPVKKHEDSCEFWKDAGQQYHIRVGWIRNLKNRKERGEAGSKD